MVTNGAELSGLKVVIVGAGLCGLASAISISLAGHQVTVLESFPRLHEVGAGLQTTPNAARLFQRWGLWPALEPHAAKMRLLRIQRFDGRVLAERKNYDVETYKHYQVPLCGFHRIDLQAALAKRAEELGVKIRFASKVVDLDQQNPSVILENGETVYGDLIVAADGLKSTLRSIFLGVQTPAQPTGHMAYRIVVDADDVDDEDLLVWLREARNNIWIGPESHAVAYSVRNATLLNIVLLVKDDLPLDVAKAPADVDQMRLLFKDWDPILTRFLAKTNKVDKWRLHHRDSCHPILPYMSQGANSSFEDAAVIGSLLAHVRTVDQLKPALEMYQAMRLQRTKAIHAMTFQQGIDLHLPDGPEQEDRDRKLARSFESEKEGEPRWTHPKWQPWIWGYDAYQDAEDTYARNPF